MVVVHKAFAAVVRATGGVPELLVFEHPDGSIQIPKGTVDPGEAPAVAALRELEEESGLTHAALVEALPREGRLVDGERQIWHAWVATVPEAPDAWDHRATGSSEEQGMVFRLHWLPVHEAAARVHPRMASVAEAVARSGHVAQLLWDAKAHEWEDWIGDEGDRNRQLNSDPVLWQLLGDVENQRVLDLGCGTGYLAALLEEAGAWVEGVDSSPAMVEHAVARGIEARVDDAQKLLTCDDDTYHVVVSNYVLMDLPDLDAACAAIARVLRPGGRAVVVFSHPCFTAGERLDDETLQFRQSYFERGHRSERWGPFATPFSFWHRPLSDWLRAFRGAGLMLDALEEPVVGPDAPLDTQQLRRSRMFPYSVAVRLLAPGRSDFDDDWDAWTEE